MDLAKKYAKAFYEDGAVDTTCSTSRHGMSRVKKRIKRSYNKRGRRWATKVAFKDWD